MAGDGNARDARSATRRKAGGRCGRQGAGQKRGSSGRARWSGANGRRIGGKCAPAPLTLDEARRWARVGVLSALALVLSYIETFIPLPVPVPGVKLGLANIVVLIALEALDFKSAAAIAAIKVLAAGFLFGNPLMMAYSALGTLLALLGMALLVRVPGLHVVFVAIAGAILHNAGQLLVAAVMLRTALVWASFPVLAIAAVVTGALTGAFGKRLLDDFRAQEARA